MLTKLNLFSGSRLISLSLSLLPQFQSSQVFRELRNSTAVKRLESVQMRACHRHCSVTLHHIHTLYLYLLFPFICLFPISSISAMLGSALRSRGWNSVYSVSRPHFYSANGSHWQETETGEGKIIFLSFFLFYQQFW